MINSITTNHPALRAGKRPLFRQTLSLRLASVLALLLLLIGCGTANPSDRTPEPTLSEGAALITGPVLPTYAPAGSGMDALLPGELLVEGRCLYLIDEFGIWWLPVFPAGSASWEEDALVLYGDRFEIGETVSVGGGEMVGAGEIKDLTQLPVLQEPDTSCDTRNVWVVSESSRGITSTLGIDSGESNASPPEPVLPILAPAGLGGDLALHAGELMVEGRCLYLVNYIGNEFGRSLPVFPVGTASWEAGVLVLYDERVEVGEKVAVGGGEVNRALGLSSLDLLQEPDASCDTRNAWVVNGKVPTAILEEIQRRASEVTSGANHAARDYMAAVDPHMDLEEAIRRTNLIEAVRPVVMAIREEAGDTLAGVALVHKPDLHVRLRLTSEPRPILSAIIASSPLPVALSTDAALSAAESVRRVGDAIPRLQEELPEFTMLWFDERTGEVVLHWFFEGAPDELAAAETRVEAAAEALSGNIGLPVRLAYSRGITPQRHTQGGADLGG